MAHVFASRVSPWDHSIDERSFFGWEWLIAKKVGSVIAWKKSQHNYGVGSYGVDPTEHEQAEPHPKMEFGNLSKDEQDVFLKECFCTAEEKGPLSSKTGYAYPLPSGELAHEDIVTGRTMKGDPGRDQACDAAHAAVHAVERFSLHQGTILHCP